jgi:hypothetical protein
LIYNDASFTLPPVNNGQSGALEYVGSGPNGEQMEDSNKGGRRDRGSGVYLRSQVL